MADASDLKSDDDKTSCGFNSHTSHHISKKSDRFIRAMRLRGRIAHENDFQEQIIKVSKAGREKSIISRVKQGYYEK